MNQPVARQLVIVIAFVGIAFIRTVFVGTAVADEPSQTVRSAVERGLMVLERGARAYPSHQSCFSCHHQTLPMLAMTSARDAGLKFDKALFEEQRSFTRKSFDSRRERLAKGEHVGGRAATVSYGLWALSLPSSQPNELNDKADEPGNRPAETSDRRDELGAAMTAYLLSVQQPDGRWKPPSNRPPLEVSSISCTVLSAIGIQRFAAKDQQEQANSLFHRCLYKV